MDGDFTTGDGDSELDVHGRTARQRVGSGKDWQPRVEDERAPGQPLTAREERARRREAATREAAQAFERVMHKAASRIAAAWRAKVWHQHYRALQEERRHPGSGARPHLASDLALVQLERDLDLALTDHLAKLHKEPNEVTVQDALCALSRLKDKATNAEGIASVSTYATVRRASLMRHMDEVEHALSGLGQRVAQAHWAS